MKLCETRQARNFFIQARIVLHGAGTQREKTVINGKIQCRKTYKVPDNLWQKIELGLVGVIALASLGLFALFGVAIAG